MKSPFATPAAQINPVTDRQRDYLIDLARKKAVLSGSDFDEFAANKWVDTIAFSGASDEINALKADIEELRRNQKTVEIEDGFYQLDGVATPIRVIHAVHGSGHQYARALNPDTHRWDVQIPGLLARLASDGERIDTDPDLAPELGKLYGICMVCGTTLTDKSPGGSIELGIGPVCRANRGW